MFLNLPPMSGALVEVKGPKGVRQAVLVTGPAGGGAGFIKAQIKYPACGNLDIVFVIYQMGGAITGTFRVDEVASQCNTMFPDIPELTTQVASARNCGDDQQCDIFAVIGDAISATPPVFQPVNRVPRLFIALAILLVILAAAGLFILFRRRRSRRAG
jgi:hypothetical protein